MGGYQSLYLQVGRGKLASADSAMLKGVCRGVKDTFGRGSAGLKNSCWGELSKVSSLVLVVCLSGKADNGVLFSHIQNVVTRQKVLDKEVAVFLKSSSHFGHRSVSRGGPEPAKILAVNRPYVGPYSWWYRSLRARGRLGHVEDSSRHLAH